jgi:hypothetical protein
VYDVRGFPRHLFPFFFFFFFFLPECEGVWDGFVFFTYGDFEDLYISSPGALAPRVEICGVWT